MDSSRCVLQGQVNNTGYGTTEELLRHMNKIATMKA